MRVRDYLSFLGPRGGRLTALWALGCALGSSSCSDGRVLEPASDGAGGEASEKLGNLSLSVTGTSADDAEFSITSIDVTITDAQGNLDVKVPDFDVSGPGSSVALTIQLEAGQDYVITAMGSGSGAVDTNGDGVDEAVATPCSGSATFDIAPGQTAIVDLVVLCIVPSPDVDTGGTAVGTEFSWQRYPECGITTLLAAPLAVPAPGGEIILTSAATPGSDFSWSVSPADLGHFEDPSSPTTRFECELWGSGTLRLSTSNEAELCTDFVDVPIECTCACTCGDGVLEPGEECDGADTAVGTTCNSRCRYVRCGDGVAEAEEACDDGNVVSGDGCDASCSLEECGDGLVQAALGEQCEPPGAQYTGGALCGADCRLAAQDCVECTSQACAPVLGGCEAAENGSKCTDLMACFASSACSLNAEDEDALALGCLCGSSQAAECAQGLADGPCLAEAQLAASETESPASVVQTVALLTGEGPGSAEGLAIVDARELALCQIAQCSVACLQY